jgi:outer membrane protein|tara:strand:+ start:164 stop:673 length:510 start_codon:yes stop_codon:yes gene_type:complete
MKKFFIFIFFWNINLSYANENIFYIDINYILENSIVGKSINTQIKKIQNKENENFKIEEKKLIEKEKKLISQKNILDEKQFKIELDKHKKNLSNYRNQKKDFIDNLNKKKTDYLKIVLNSLNPIISKYVEENEISLVLQKKNIIVAKKELDITIKILELLDNKLKKIEF